VFRFQRFWVTTRNHSRCSNSRARQLCSLST
jgi:hypothetical protein